MCVFILVIIGILHWQEKVRTSQPFLFILSLIWFKPNCTSLTPVFPVSSMDLFETLQHPCFLLCRIIVTSHRLILQSLVCTCVWRSEQMGVSVCGPALRLSLRVLHTHCYAANCFVLSFQHIKSVPHYPTHFVLQGVMCEFVHVKPGILSLCVGRWLFAFLYAICTSECVNSFLLNTQNWSQQSASQLVFQQLICEVDELI